MVLVLAAVLALAAGCGTRDSVAGAAGAGGALLSQESTPLPDLPTYPGADPVGEQESDHGTISQEFRASGATPIEVMDFFASELRLWEVEEEVVPTGPATFRGRWTRDGVILTVTAQPAPASTPKTGDYRLAVRGG